MSACNFEHLLQFVNNQLDLDKQLVVYDHLDRCDICRDAVFQISRDLDKLFFFYCVQCAGHNLIQHQTGMLRSRRAELSTNVPARSAMTGSSNRLGGSRPPC